MENPIIEISNDDIFENFENIINESHMFSVNSRIDNLNTFIFYVDDGEVVNYKRYEIDIDNGVLKKKDFLTLVLNNNKYYSQTYDLIGIYKYGFNLQQEDLKTFCNDHISHSFITSYTKLDDIVFEPCIELFKENNCLFLFFNKQKPKRRSAPKKETVSQDNPTEVSQDKTKNKTVKKVRFNLENNKNKTIKRT